MWKDIFPFQLFCELNDLTTCVSEWLLAAVLFFFLVVPFLFPLWHYLSVVRVCENEEYFYGSSSKQCINLFDQLIFSSLQLERNWFHG